MPELFVLGTGQEDNIGDSVLRREYFDRLREIGCLHIYLGPTSTDFLESLRLHDSDIVYESLRQWHSVAWRTLVRRRVWFVDKPGELGLDRRTFRRQLKLLPLVLGVRFRRGQVLRLGLAMRAVNPVYLKYLRPMFRLSTMVRWRDTSTSSVFRFGASAPDWAFGWDESEPDALGANRSDIVVTYREDRALPSDMILDSLVELARDGKRRVVVVTQVRRDAARSADLASRLDAELVPWPAERTLADHEEILRELYRKSALVVSDRLHALIVGMTEGAVPLCITDSGEPKVGRHFDAVGFKGSTLCTKDNSAPLSEAIEHQIGRRAEAVAATHAARTALDDLTAQLAALASTQRSGRGVD